MAWVWLPFVSLIYNQCQTLKIVMQFSCLPNKEGERGIGGCFIKTTKEFLLATPSHLTSSFSNIKKIYVRGLSAFDGCFHSWRVIIALLMWPSCNGDCELIRLHIPSATMPWGQDIGALAQHQSSHAHGSAGWKGLWYFPGGSSL